MLVYKKDNYTLLKPNKNAVNQFFTEFKNRCSEFTNTHLIIDFSEHFNIKTEKILLLLELSTQHKDNGTSFVIVSNSVEIEDLPEKINVVPTLTEALDILELDAIERDLGF